jgi:hypothetical protein
VAAALITALTISIAALFGTLIRGYGATSADALRAHATLGIFTSLILLLSHSMAMFYLIGKGKAIREAVDGGGLARGPVAAVSAVRRPVFCWAPIASLVMMAATIVGAGVDTGTVSAGVHAALGLASLGANVVAFRAEAKALLTLTRVTRDVNRQLGA